MSWSRFIVPTAKQVRRTVTREQTVPAEQALERTDSKTTPAKPAESVRRFMASRHEPLARLRKAVREVEKQPPAPRRTEQAQRLLTEVNSLERPAGPQAELAKLRQRLEAVIAPPPPETTLTAGRQDAGGVTVEETVLDGRTRKVDIDGSFGVVVGDDNRQDNHFHYEVADSPVSLPELLTATPALERALANLIEDPGNARAARTMKDLLEQQADKLLSGKGAITTTSEPKRARLTGVLGPGGEVVVTRSKGVVVGRGNVQKNHFHYRVEKPQALLARALAQNAGALKRIAEVYGKPGTRDADRDLGAMLAKLITAKPQVNQVIGSAPVKSVRNATGVTLGARNLRTDTVHPRLRYKLGVTVRAEGRQQ
ncbi:hypothetical protein ACIBKY_04235 [Nonomuraea sp. NPDC050394]|uniref:hypothetical protein n=1 Tax=Nonomuraea sp. NPDC050394 TaxID=3364363 RepID=UPI0037B69D98